MARGPIHKLSSGCVKTSGPGFHADGGGLYLSVKPGSRSWAFRYSEPGTGRRREMGLGNADSLPVAAARERAADLRGLVAQGIDPLGKPEAPTMHGAGRATTFGQVFDYYFAANAPSWRNPKHRQQWQNTIGTYAKGIIKRPVAEITTADILACLTPIWTAKPETARRVRGRIEMVLDYAVAHGHREPGPNPASLSVIRQGLPRVKQAKTHFAAVGIEDAPATFRAIWERRNDGQGAAALALLILGGFRPGEVRGLRWSDLQADRIEIPGLRMKAGRRHRVPLTGPMSALLDREKLAETVFFGNGGKPLSDATLSAVHKRLGIEATCHGWRSTFRQWAAHSGWSRDLAESALAHTLARNDVEAAYLRDADLLDARRPMMDAWARHLLGEPVSDNTS
ncbi:tyrosine-type recombinase/integrase [Paracoccus ravus]|uniref:tyrosine-type recombinase/integrase n=1 Tax=Paracoccus ravus TaxID=2447760 RepID=UPI001FD6765E|nr:integrase arm-type DNA-binding domain-containing protein [Paracoccus ravus]